MSKRISHSCHGLDAAKSILTGIAERCASNQAHFFLIWLLHLSDIFLVLLVLDAIVVARLED